MAIMLIIIPVALADNTVNVNGNIHGQFVAPPSTIEAEGNDGAARPEGRYSGDSDDDTPKLLHRIQQNESILALAVSRSLGLIFSGSGSGEIMVGNWDRGIAHWP